MSDNFYKMRHWQCHKNKECKGCEVCGKKIKDKRNVINEIHENQNYSRFNTRVIPINKTSNIHTFMLIPFPDDYLQRRLIENINNIKFESKSKCYFCSRDLYGSVPLIINDLLFCSLFCCDLIKS